MNNEYNVKDKLTLFLLATGVFCFGVILPDSLSTHVKMVHYAAHFGMSFLLALSFYLICTVKMRISKKFSYTVLIVATLLIGAIYKYWEISTKGMIGNYSFHTIIDHSGTMTSMSQNISGLMGAMLLIEGLLHRNLVSTALKSDKLHVNNRGNMHVVSKIPGNKPLSNIAASNHFSAVAEN
jgi:glucan phosphoethanolaminetransferase (alkaline phosphatase superfamily)